MVKKRFLFIFRSPPYGQSLAREGIDALLTSAAYDQPTQVLFMNDGVHLLRKNQQADSLQQKNLEKMLGALELYDINDIYASEDCLSERGLPSNALAVGVKTVNKTEISTLCEAQDVILQF